MVGTQVVVMLCDPVRRLVSHWNYRKYIWEWDRIANTSHESLRGTVRRQIAELPHWIRDHHPDRNYQSGILELDGEVSPSPVGCRFPFSCISMQHSDALPQDSHGILTLVAGGLYAVAMERLLNIFPSEQVLVLDKSEYSSNPRTVIYRVEEFLGLQHHDFPDKVIEWKANINLQGSGRHDDRTSDACLAQFCLVVRTS
eukprot:m.110000 g.110000  ORF g.110000 m.110000 type:complete len:199 (-) comp51788_c0_seq26:279-875(-)